MTDLSSEQLLEQVAAELSMLHSNSVGMRIEVEPAVIFAVVGMCQLALRHPDTKASEPAKLCRHFIEHVRQKFQRHAPAVAEAIRRGNDPNFDEPRQPPRMDKLIDRGRGMMDFILSSETPRTPEEIVAFMDSRRAPAPAILTCPFCHYSQPAPFEKVDLYICAGCGRTVET